MKTIFRLIVSAVFFLLAFYLMGIFSNIVAWLVTDVPFYASGINNPVLELANTNIFLSTLLQVITIIIPLFLAFKLYYSNFLQINLKSVTISLSIILICILLFMIINTGSVLLPSNISVFILFTTILGAGFSFFYLLYIFLKYQLSRKSKSMKFIKFVIELLVFCVISFVVFRVGGIFINNVLGIHISQISRACCGLEEGSVVAFREFNPATLKHGEIIIYKDPKNNADYIIQVIAFPNEALFADLHTGKRGYAPKQIAENWDAGSTEEEISNIFAQITWLDNPTFQETIPSTNLHDRLVLFPIDEEKYKITSDLLTTYTGIGTASPEQIISVYDKTLISADNAWLYSLIMSALPIVVSLAIFILLSRIFKKLKKNKSLSDMPQPPTA